MKTKTGIELIAEERQRQIGVEGWTAEHDEKHTDGQLAKAAACYAVPDNALSLASPVYHIQVDRKIWWPFDWLWWKPTPDSRIRELQKAGALIAAEIDRLQRLI